MIDSEHLRFFLTEELYVLDEKQTEEASSNENLVQEDTAVEPKQQSKTEEVQEPIAKPETAEIKEKPERSEKLLVASKTMTEGEKELLAKILGAIGITQEEYELEIGSTKKMLNHKKAILFHDKPFGEFYKTTNYKGTEILSSKLLSDLDNSVPDKKQLWGALKSWFNIS